MELRTQLRSITAVGKIVADSLTKGSNLHIHLVGMRMAGGTISEFIECFHTLCLQRSKLGGFKYIGTLEIRDLLYFRLLRFLCVQKPFQAHIPRIRRVGQRHRHSLER